MIEIPFIPGILIMLVISILMARAYGIIADYIGEQIRMFFLNLWQVIKK